MSSQSGIRGSVPRQPDRRPGPWIRWSAGISLVLLTSPPTAGHASTGSHLPSGGPPIPAFSRLYGTGCSTCHTAAPKLNVLGEAFRLNGYRMPTDPALVRRDDPVPLGAPEWDEAWPRVIRSSDVPGLPPLAMRIVSDAHVTRDERTSYDATYVFPRMIQLLAGTPLGDDVSVFVDGGWDQEHGLELHQARVELHDAVPGIPSRVFNLRVGLQHLYLLTLMDQHIDRAARQDLGWQSFDPSEVEVRLPGTLDPSPVPRHLSLEQPQAAVEANGVLGGRLYYAAGVSQGLQDGATDTNGRKDVYYKLRYKAGGLDLAGRYSPGEQPDVDTPGQLLDRGLVLEHFGYFGDESTSDAPERGHRAFGVALRGLLGPLDLGLGYVVRVLDRPWPDLASGRLTATSVFSRAEYLALPWALASLKVERFDVSLDALPDGATGVPASSEATRLMPGLVFLLRQNLRLVVEGELFIRSPATDRADLARPHGLWMRLDVAF